MYIYWHVITMVMAYIHTYSLSEQLWIEVTKIIKIYTKYTHAHTYTHIHVHGHKNIHYMCMHLFLAKDSYTCTKEDSKSQDDTHTHTHTHIIQFYKHTHMRTLHCLAMSVAAL